MKIDQVPDTTREEMPRNGFAPSVGIVATAAATGFSRGIVSFLHGLLLALQASRLEQARREIDSLRHLLPRAKEATGPDAAAHRCGGGHEPTRSGAQGPAEACRRPPRAA
jgi:hypothetical protein